MEILLGTLAAWGLIMLLWLLAGLMLLPLGRRTDSEITVVLRCHGRAAWLERQIRGLLWLRDTGVLWWDILVLDVAMDEEARDRARRLELTYKQVRLMGLEEMKEWIKHEPQ